MVFLLLCLAGREMRSLFPLGIMNLLAILFSTPHYGATLLRVYQRSEDRRAYRFFALYLTLALGLAFYWGLQNLTVGAWLFTLYLTWSPWHYTGQNYGVAVMYLGRRGVTATAPVKRLLYASFVLSYVITFLFIHGTATDSRGTYLPGEIHYVSLGIPALVADFGLLLVGLAYLVTSGVALFLLRRASSLRALFPALGLMGMQALWFVLPALVKNWSPYSKLMPPLDRARGVRLHLDCSRARRPVPLDHQLLRYGLATCPRPARFLRPSACRRRRDDPGPSLRPGRSGATSLRRRALRHDRGHRQPASLRPR